jgi:zinc transport system substrate-binding protein
MSLKGAEIEAKNIKDGLVKADPSNREYYEKNCGDFVSKLESLYAEYDKKFKSVSKKSFVTGHAAFGYLCRDFGLEQNSVEDVYAEGEPSAQQLAELVKYCKKNKVTTVFVEQMASPEISKTLAKEVGAKTETIYTLESTEDGKPYLERMENNLSKIYESLGGRA